MAGKGGSRAGGAGRWKRAATLALCAAASLSSAACHGPARPSAAAGAMDVFAYLPPPTVTTAQRDAQGRVALSGRAPGEAEVRLHDPDGGAFSATANEGGWSMQLPAAADPRMFAFEGEVAGRVLHGEGALLILPAPSPVAVLTRAGYGALVIGAQPGALHITAIDYDGAGGGAVSGIAAPRAPIRFVLDGQAVGAAEADDKGRFTVLDLRPRQPFGVGEHAVRIESQTRAVEGPVRVTPAAALGAAPFRVQREADAWRADWRIPGGGTQTTVVFDAPSPPAPPSSAPATVSVKP